MVLGGGLLTANEQLMNTGENSGIYMTLFSSHWPFKVLCTELQWVNVRSELTSRFEGFWSLFFIFLFAEGKVGSTLPTFVPIISSTASRLRSVVLVWDFLKVLTSQDLNAVLHWFCCVLNCVNPGKHSEPDVVHTPSAYSAPGTPPANRSSFVGVTPRDPGGLYQAQVSIVHLAL